MFSGGQEVTELSLDGAMIPRAVKRRVDARLEPRVPAEARTAMLIWRGRKAAVTLVNTSPSGAMLAFPQVPNIGERVALELPGRGRCAARVCWVRAGRVGVCFEPERG
jgi:hypothetical protein